MNQVCLIGRIARDIELRDTSTGSKFVGFTLAVSDYSGGKEYTNFIPCVAWDKQAENMARFLKKGSQVAVTGRISVRNNNTDGRYETIVNVNADRVEFLDSRSGSNDQQSSNNTYTKNDSNFDLDQVNGFANQQAQPINDSSKEDEIILSDDESVLWD
ncbi:single-stranded DNA-binding protein [[Acholeplasma] multilocale]|uniref:single-stranded DNA-binding protein n=1 Tax=[Acholeplasma] multilocale TaxID=264638 RepID=UPI00054F1F94|nr:single-stranded DNA-binding protein [[Acholeplasma] multilocale]